MSTARLSLFSAICLSAVVATATAVPALRVDQLVHDSDVVAIVSVERIDDAGAITTELNGQPLPANAFVAQADVLEVIKGMCAEKITIRYELLSTGIYAGLPQRVRSVAFLRSAGGEFRFTSPFYPTLPADPKPEPSAEKSPEPDATERVVAELGKALISSESTVSDKNFILLHAQGVPKSSRAFAEALKTAEKRENNIDLRYRMIAELIGRDDVSELGHAKEWLLSTVLTPGQREMFSYAIGERLSNPLAAPSISELIRSPYTVTRRAAARALWRIGDRTTVGSLAVALQDNDNDVRYYAVRGLAVMNNEPEWDPSIPEFSENGIRYVHHWTEWAQANGYIKRR